MKELLKIDKEKQITSREIAELTGKSHSHVMRDIRNAEASYLEVYGEQSTFGEGSYTLESTFSQRQPSNR